mgnify:CR=1 FL=1
MSKYGYYLGMTPEQQDIVKMVREFAERELDPVVKEYDEKGEFPVQLHEKWGEMGLFGLDVPEQYGGLGLNAVTRYCISEELAKLENAVEREVYANRAAETAGLSPDAMRQEVERAARKRRYSDRKKRERQELNPALTVQPAQRGSRYTNLRSAMAEEGVIRLLHLDPTLFGDTPPLTPEEFSSPLLGKIYGAMWHQRGNRSGLSALTGELSGDEMSHLTTLLQKPESTANASQALADYIRVIREEQTKRDDSGVDPLLLAMETFKDKKRYGGKRT